MEFLFRVGICVPLLFLVAIVVTAQHQATAMATLHDALRRTGRWTLWLAVLLGSIFALELLFIGW